MLNQTTFKNLQQDARGFSSSPLPQFLLPSQVSVELMHEPSLQSNVPSGQGAASRQKIKQTCLQP